MSAKPAHLTPGQVFARRVKEARERLGWTQQQLADRVTELGLPVDRTTITRLEKGQRAQLAPLDKVFAIAAALETPPYALLTPAEDDAPIAITPNTSIPAWWARAWMRGVATLPGAGLNFAELPEADLRKLLKPAVKKRLTRGMNRRTMSAIARRLMDLNIDAEAERIAAEIADEIRNPKEEEDG